MFRFKSTLAHAFVPRNAFASCLTPDLTQLGRFFSFFLSPQAPDVRFPRLYCKDSPVTPSPHEDQRWDVFTEYFSRLLSAASIVVSSLFPRSVPCPSPLRFTITFCNLHVWRDFTVLYSSPTVRLSILPTTFYTACSPTHVFFFIQFSPL